MRISKKVSETLLEQGGWVLNEKYSARLGVGTLVWLNNQHDKVLVKLTIGNKSTYRMFEPMSEFYALVQDHKPKSNHMLLGLLPYGKDFPAHIDEMVQALAEVLNVPVEALDYTSSSLDRLSPKIKRRGREACLNSPAIFAGLVAYSMEIARRQLNWRWVMLKSEFHDVWEPWLADDQGWYYSNWITLYTTFAETEYGLSVTGLDGIPVMQRRRAPSE